MISPGKVGHCAKCGEWRMVVDGKGQCYGCAQVHTAGCGKQTHVSGTNGGTMPCGASLKWPDGTMTVELCAKCLPNYDGANP